MCVVLARPNSGKDHMRDLAQRKMRPQSSMGFGENIYKLKNADKASFHSSIEAEVMPAPTSKISRRVRIRSRFRSVNVHAEQGRFELR